MTKLLAVALVVAASSPAPAIVAVFGNVALSGDADRLKRLVPAFRACGVRKIRYEHDRRVTGTAYLDIDQNPAEARIFGCVRRLVLAQRPGVSVIFRAYGRDEI